MTNGDPVVLVVEDSKNDAFLMRTVFKRAGFEQTLRFVVDGDSAIAYLQGDGPYRDRTQFPMPAVVLMDLNMPRKNGFEILEWIRSQPLLKRLHVYILSASSRPEDIDRAYDLGANSYLLKPSNLEELAKIANCLVAWFKICHFAPMNKMDEHHEAVSAGGGSQVEHGGNHPAR